MTMEEIIDNLELYTVGRLKKERVFITVEELQNLIDEIKALEQEPCEDVVSRQTVKEQMIKYGFLAPDMTVTEFIEDLPSVQPVRKRDDVWDKIRAEIEQAADKQFQIAMGVADLNERYTHIRVESAYRHSLNIIDKYKAESEG